MRANPLLIVRADDLYLLRDGQAADAADVQHVQGAHVVRDENAARLGEGPQPGGEGRVLLVGRQTRLGPILYCPGMRMRKTEQPFRMCFRN